METPQAACPRCGYDFSGLIASWLQSCPLRSTCSECGLDFDCGRVLSPQLLGPVWCYEHSARRSSSRWWETSAIVLNPARLCRELEVDHFVRAWRLVRFLVIWLIIAHCVLSALVMAAGSPQIAWAPPGVSAILYRCGNLAFPLNLFLSALIWPTAFDLALPAGTSGYVQFPTLPLVVLVLLPWLLMPLWTVLLDATFRMARVRQIHLLRGLAYSLPGTIVWLYALLLFFAASAIWRGANHPWEGNRPFAAAIFLLYLIYHIAWWYHFIARYLRLNQAAAIVAVHSFMTLLALAAAGAIFFAGGML